MLGTGLTAVLSLIYVVYAGRRLGPADYADFTATVSIVSLLSLALGPINGIVTRFTAQYAARGEYGKVRTLSYEIIRRVGAYGLVIVVAGLVLAMPLSGLLQFNSPLPLIMAWLLVYFSLLLNVPRGLLRGIQAFGRYSVNNVMEAAVRLGTGLPLLHWMTTVLSGLTAYMIALAAVLAFSMYQVTPIWRDHPAEPVDGSAVKRFTWAMFLAASIGAGFQNIDMLFVKHLFDPAVAGHYGAAFTLARSISLIATPFGLQLLPQITHLYERGAAIRKPFIRLAAGFVLLSAVPIIIFWIWGEEVVVLLYGSPYEAAGPLLATLALASTAGYLAGLLAIALSGINDFRFLRVYLPALAVEAIALGIWHGSLQTVVIVVLLAQGVRLAAMVIMTLKWARGPSPAGKTP